MANIVEVGADVLHDRNIQLAQSRLIKELATLGSKLEDRTPNFVESELLSSSLPYRLYYSLDAYPPLDNNPHYQIVEQYLSCLYGQRGDIRILQMAFSAPDTLIRVGQAISYPDITEDVAWEDRIVDPKTERDFSNIVRFNQSQGLASVNFFRSLGSRTKKQDQVLGRVTHFVDPEVLFAFSGIVVSEMDLGRWSVELDNTRSTK